MEESFSRSIVESPTHNLGVVLRFTYSVAAYRLRRIKREAGVEHRLQRVQGRRASRFRPGNRAVANCRQCSRYRCRVQAVGQLR